MRIPLSHSAVFVPQSELHLVEGGAVVDQKCCKIVSQIVKMQVFYSGFFTSPLECFADLIATIWLPIRLNEYIRALYFAVFDSSFYDCVKSGSHFFWKRRSIFHRDSGNVETLL